jgi:hypothetical protein
MGRGQRVLRVGDPRLFKLEDRIVNARCQQMGLANSEKISLDLWIARTRRIACSWAGISSSIDPVTNLHQPSP